VIITKLQVASVELDMSSQSSSMCRASRARRVEPVELCSSTSSTQPKCMGSTRRTCRVESSQVEFGLIPAPVSYGSHIADTLWCTLLLEKSFRIILCSIWYILLYREGSGLHLSCNVDACIRSWRSEMLTSQLQECQKMVFLLWRKHWLATCR